MTRFLKTEYWVLLKKLGTFMEVQMDGARTQLKDSQCGESVGYMSSSYAPLAHNNEGGEGPAGRQALE